MKYHIKNNISKKEVKKSWKNIEIKNLVRLMVIPKSDKINESKRLRANDGRTDEDIFTS